MPRNRLLIVLFVVTALLSVMIPATGAQDATAVPTGNLLRDPGFEFSGVWKRVATGTAEGDGGTTFNVAPDWEGWFTESPRSQSWQNRMPNGFPRSNAGFGFVRSGNRSQEIARGDATFTAAIYQTVAVAEGSNVIGSAWFVMNISGNNASNANSQARVGIDPNGGNNPFDSDVVWSTWGTNQLASNGFRQLTVSATATGTNVTLFLYSTQTVPTEGNGIYWDDASLTIGGAGGSAGGQNVSGTPVAVATAVPTAPPLAPFVNAQGASSDGSIIHIVQPGDTLDAIAVAYGVTRDEIAALNNLASIRFLSIGQEIVIRGPQENASDDDEEVDDAETEEAEEEEPTPRNTATPRNSQQSSGGDEEADDAAETEEVTETEEPTEEPTNTPVPATNTPAPTAPVAVADTQDNLDVSSQSGVVCVTLFEDTNMNRIQDQNELYLAGGQIELTNGGDTVGAIATDDTPDPLCFEDLESGEYIVLASAPAGYGLTTSDQLRLRVQPGSTLNVSFGAAEGVAVAQAPPADAEDLAQEVALDTTPEEDDNSDLLAISGLIVFGLAGLTLIGGLGAMLLLRRR